MVFNRDLLYVGFLYALWFLPRSQLTHDSRWIGYAKLCSVQQKGPSEGMNMGLNDYINERMHGAPAKCDLTSHPAFLG